MKHPYYRIVTTIDYDGKTKYTAEKYVGGLIWPQYRMMRSYRSLADALSRIDRERYVSPIKSIQYYG